LNRRTITDLVAYKNAGSTPARASKKEIVQLIGFGLCYVRNHAPGGVGPREPAFYCILYAHVLISAAGLQGEQPLASFTNVK